MSEGKQSHPDVVIARRSISKPRGIYSALHTFYVNAKYKKRRIGAKKKGSVNDSAKREIAVVESERAIFPALARGLLI